MRSPCVRPQQGSVVYVPTSIDRPHQHSTTSRQIFRPSGLGLHLRKIAWYLDVSRPAAIWFSIHPWQDTRACHRWSLKLEASPPRGTVDLRIMLGYDSDTYMPQQTVRGIVSCRCPGRGRGHRESQRLALLFPRSRLVMATSTLTPPTFSVQRSAFDARDPNRSIARRDRGR